MTVGEDMSGDAPLDAARARVLERLRARRTEIDEAIFTRVRDGDFDPVFDPRPHKAPSTSNGLRAAVLAAINYVLDGLEHPQQLTQPLPTAAVNQARRAARFGVRLDTVLRRYIAGYALLEDFVMEEAEHDELLAQSNMLRGVLASVAALVDRLTTAVAIAYREQTEPSTALSLTPFTSPHPPFDPSPPLDPNPPLAPPYPSAPDNSLAAKQRARILAAMSEVVAERGFAGASVALVTTRAKISRRTFYEQFEGLRDCFLAVLDLGLARSGPLVADAFLREHSWQDAILAALASLLSFYDSEPHLTRVWFVDAMAAGPWALEHREQIVADLQAMIIQRWSPPAQVPQPHTAAAVMASVLGLIQTHLVTKRPEPLITLLGPLMRVILTPILLNEHLVAEQVHRADRLAHEIGAEASTSILHLPPDPTATLPEILSNPNARRLRECLLFLAQQGGRGISPSNHQIATAIGITQKSHISRLLADLLREGLVLKSSEGPGKPNAWRLTQHGQQISNALAQQDN